MHPLVSEVEKLCEEAHRLTFEVDTWTPIKVTKNATIYKGPGTSNKMNAFKCEALIYDIESNKLNDMCHPTEKYRILWDPFLSGCDLLEEVTHNAVLVHHKMKPILMGLIAPRDSIDLVVQDERPEYYSSKYASFDLPKYPPESKFVRCHNMPSAVFCMKEKENNALRIHLLLQSNMNLAHVPISVLETAYPSMMLQFVSGLQSCSKVQWEALGNIPGRRTAREFEEIYSQRKAPPSPIPPNNSCLF